MVAAGNLVEMRTTRGMLLPIEEVEDGWMQRDRKADPDVLCVTFMVRNIGLVHEYRGSSRLQEGGCMALGPTVGSKLV